MEVQMGPDPIDEPSLLYKLQRKIQVFKTKDPLPNRGYNLVASSSKYGLVFVAVPDGTLSVYQLNQLVDKDCEPLHVSVKLQEKPTHIAVSCDYEMLAVTGGKFLTIYKVPDFQNPSVSPSFSVQTEVEQTTNYCFVSALQWNPCIPDSIVMAFYDGTLLSCLVYTGQVKKVLGRARCICWSPKGKQFVTGNSDGTLIQYKPELTAAKLIPAPNLFEGSPVEVLAIYWVSTFQFAVVYRNAMDNSRPAVTIVNTPKVGQSSCISYQDICYSMGSNRPWYYYLQGLPQWNIIMTSSSNSMEIGTLGSTDGANWLQWSQTDEARPELPLTDKKIENYPIGLSIDTCALHQLPWGENDTLPHMPLLHVVSQNGLLTTFNIINLKREALQLCNAPALLTLSAQALTSAIPGAALASPAITAALAASKPAVIQPAAPVVQQAQPAPPVLQPNTATASATIKIPSYAPKTSNQATIAALAYQQHEQRQNVESIPATVYLPQVTTAQSKPQPQPKSQPQPYTQPQPQGQPQPHTLPQPHVQPQPQAQPQPQPQAQPQPHVQPQPQAQPQPQPQAQPQPQPQPVAPKPKAQENAEVNTEQEKANKAKANQELKDMLVKEVNDFQTELYNFMVKTRETQARLQRDIDTISTNFSGISLDTEELKKECSMEELRGAIVQLKLELVRACAVVAEARTHSDAKDLHQWSQADPLTTKRVASVKKLAYYVQGQLAQARAALDYKYNEIDLRDTQYSKPGKRMIRPILDDVYQPLVKQQEILSRQQAVLRTLKSTLADCDVEPVFKSTSLLRSTPFRNNKDPLSKLTKNILNMSLEPETKPKRHQLSPSKLDALRDALSNHKTVRIKPVNIELRQHLEMLKKNYLKSVKEKTEKVKSLPPPAKMVKVAVAKQPNPEPPKQLPATAFTPVTNIKSGPANVARALFTDEPKQEVLPQTVVPRPVSKPLEYPPAGAETTYTDTKSVLKDVITNRQANLEAKNNSNLFMGQKICSPTQPSAPTPSSAPSAVFTSKPISEINNMFNKFQPQAFVPETKPTLTTRQTDKPTPSAANVKSSETGEPEDTDSPKPKPMTNLFGMKSPVAPITPQLSTSRTSLEQKPTTKPLEKEAETIKENVPERVENVPKTVGKVADKKEMKPLSSQANKSFFFGPGSEANEASTSSGPKPLDLKIEDPKVSISAVSSASSIFASANASLSTPKPQSAFSAPSTSIKTEPVSPTDSEPSSIFGSAVASQPKTTNSSSSVFTSTSSTIVFGSTSPGSGSPTQTQPVPNRLAMTSADSVFEPVSTSQPTFSSSLPVLSLTAAHPQATYITDRLIYQTAASSGGSLFKPAPVLQSTANGSNSDATTTASAFGSSLITAKPAFSSGSGTLTFGTPTSTTASIFGSTTPSAVTTATTANIFGTATPSLAPSTTIATVFGSSSPSVVTTTSASVFGSTSPIVESNTTASAFGSSSVTVKSVFGSGATGFGAATPTTVSAFGSTTPSVASTATTATIFGSSTPSVPSPTTTATVFGSTSPIVASTTAASIFGSPTSSTGPVFAATTTTPSASVFAPNQASFASTEATNAFNSTTSLLFAQAAQSAFGTTTQASIFGAPTTQASVFSPTSQTSVFGAHTQTTQASIFGTPTATTQASIFGTPTPASQPSLFGTPTQSTQASVFGSPTQTTQVSVFGSPTQTTQASIFGTPTQTTQASIFGQPATSAQSGSLFGGGESNLFASASISSPTPNSGGNIFGSSSGSVFGGGSPNVFGGKSTFGQPSAAAASIFGGSSFGEKPATNIWGSGNTTGGGGFGSSGFGQAATTQASSIFGTTGGSFSQPSAGAFSGSPQPTAFGSPTQQQQGSAFGGGAVFGSKPLFGQSAGFGSATGAGFGSPAAFGGFNKSPTSGGAFGAPAFGGGSPFGGSSPGGGFGTPTQSNATFENLATQNTLTFGNLAQQSGAPQPAAPSYNTSPSFTGWRG